MCSIVGTWASDAAYLTYLGLHSLQHRGQEAAGITSAHKDTCHVHRRRGLVTEAFQNGAISHLKGLTAIGHTRYSTTGEDNDNNIQPLYMTFKGGWISIAHNGNLVNADSWRTKLEEEGAIFQTTTDTEVIMHLIARCKNKDLVESVICALEQVEGSYSLLVMNKDKLIAIRDPYGFRPLIYGECTKYPTFASESCAFDLMGGKPIREIEPGEMFIVDTENGNVETRQVFPKKKLSQCVFEMIYFARPDSKVFGKSIQQ
jgi:amidophosphoribosyltransferase